MPVELLKNTIKMDMKFKKFLNKKEKEVVGLDSTSAPGNKTLQLAEMCKSVNAFERDPKRFQTLKSRVTKAGANDVIECI